MQGAIRLGPANLATEKRLKTYMIFFFHAHSAAAEVIVFNDPTKHQTTSVPRRERTPRAVF